MKTLIKLIIALVVCMCVAGAVWAIVRYGNDPGSESECVHEYAVSESIAATCTEAGLSYEVKCIKCGHTLIESHEVSALGHDIVTVDGIAPTCTEAGRTSSETCIKCGEVVTESQEIPALGHEIVTVDGIAPTCTEADGRQAKRA